MDSLLWIPRKSKKRTCTTEEGATEVADTTEEVTTREVEDRAEETTTDTEAEEAEGAGAEEEGRKEPELRELRREKTAFRVGSTEAEAT